MNNNEPSMPLRHSFKASKALSKGINKFGNQAISSTDPEHIEQEVSIDENGEIRYDPSYDAGLDRTLKTPAMQQFMKQRGIYFDGEGFKIDESQTANHDSEMEEENSIEMPDNIEELVEQYGDDFDVLADGISNGSIIAKIKSRYPKAESEDGDAHLYGQTSVSQRRITVASTPTKASGRLAVYCGQCGFKFKGDERFCPSCGTKRVTL